MKFHSRIDTDADDAYIETLITTVTDFFERETRTAIVATDYVLTLDTWPACRELRLPCPPLIEVDEISYIAPGGNETVLSDESYFVDDSGRPGRVVFTGNLPQTANVPAAIRISFRAGYEDVASIPPTLLHGVRLMTAHYYENREGATDRRIDTVPLAVESILNQHRFLEAA